MRSKWPRATHDRPETHCSWVVLHQPRSGTTGGITSMTLTEALDIGVTRTLTKREEHKRQAGAFLTLFLAAASLWIGLTAGALIRGVDRPRLVFRSSAPVRATAAPCWISPPRPPTPTAPPAGSSRCSSSPRRSTGGSPARSPWWCSCCCSGSPRPGCSGPGPTSGTAHSPTPTRSRQGSAANRPAPPGSSPCRGRAGGNAGGCRCGRSPCTWAGPPQRKPVNCGCPVTGGSGSSPGPGGGNRTG